MRPVEEEVGRRTSESLLQPLIDQPAALLITSHQKYLPPARLAPIIRDNTDNSRRVWLVRMMLIRRTRCFLGAWPRQRRRPSRSEHKRYLSLVRRKTDERIPNNKAVCRAIVYC